MSLELSNFDEMSRQIAKDFLRSVVVVDDNPVFEGEEVVGKLEPPDLVVEAPPTEPTMAAAAVPPTSASDPHSLPFNKFSESFATVGIFCTVLTPEKEHLDDFVAQSVGESGLANRADVVILDWVLHGFKDGEKTLDIIGKLASVGEGAKPRKRLLLVYTGEKDLLGIAAKIRTKLGLAPLEGGTVTEQTHITLGPITVAIYGKPHVNVTRELQSLLIAADAIPEIVISEFAKTSPGLLQNLILRSMGVLRSETFQILRKFPFKLDSGFVTHKVLMNPEDASAHVLPLVVSEIQSALEDNDAIQVVSDAALGAWLDSKIVTGLKFDLQGVTEVEAKNGVHDLLKRPTLDVAGDETHSNFVRGFLKSKKKARGEVSDRFAQILSGDPSHQANQEFAIMMSVRSRYGTPAPRLTLGTIVRDVSTGVYLLCTQPRCDSVRLNGPRPFPFLPLKETNVEYDHVLMHGAKIVTLQLADEPYRIQMIGFQPWTANDREVLAKAVGENLFFKSGEVENNFEWIAEFRPEHAQRIANVLAGKISRVGLNESEWLRLNTRNRDE
jgi:hypothetical protein